jgi:hypothetical protein
MKSPGEKIVRTYRIKLKAEKPTPEPEMENEMGDQELADILHEAALKVEEGDLESAMELVDTFYEKCSMAGDSEEDMEEEYD